MASNGPTNNKRHLRAKEYQEPGSYTILIATKRVESMMPDIVAYNSLFIIRE